MATNIYTTAIVEFAYHARNLNDASKVEVAELLQALDKDSGNASLEAAIEAHPRAEYAADWIMTRINNPEKFDLQSRYALACRDVEDANDFGTPLDVQRAINVRNTIAAKLNGKSRKY